MVDWIEGMQRPYEAISHTADAGIRVWGRDWEELLRNAAAGFYDLLLESGSIEDRGEERTIRVIGGDRAELLVAWLAELLYLFDVERLLFGSFTIEKGGEGELIANVRGETFDQTAHRIRTDIKAVTYHGLVVKECDRGLEAEIIFDL